MANLTNRITTNPEQCGARPCIEELPDLEPEDITASLQYASQWLEYSCPAACSTR